MKKIDEHSNRLNAVVVVMLAIAMLAFLGIVVCRRILAGILHIEDTEMNAWEIPILTTLSTVFSTAIVYILIEWSIREKADRDIVSGVTDSVQHITDAARTSLVGEVKASVQALLEEKVEAFKPAALTFRELPAEKFRQAMADAEKIYILITYAPIIALYHTDLVQSFRHNKKVSILLIDPDCPYVGLRGRQIGRDVETFRTEILSCAKNIVSYYEQAKSGGAELVFPIYYYDTAPGVSIFGTDKVLYVGTYLYGSDAIGCPFIEVKKGSPLFDRYMDHFNEVKKGAKQLVDLPSRLPSDTLI